MTFMRTPRGLIHPTTCGKIRFSTRVITTYYVLFCTIMYLQITTELSSISRRVLLCSMLHRVCTVYMYYVVLIWIGPVRVGMTHSSDRVGIRLDLHFRMISTLVRQKSSKSFFVFLRPDPLAMHRFSLRFFDSDWLPTKHCPVAALDWATDHRLHSPVWI